MQRAACGRARGTTSSKRHLSRKVANPAVVALLPGTMFLCIMPLSASRPVLPARPRVTRPHRVDRRAALQTAAAAAVAVVAPPTARASELQDGLLWVPKANAPTKAVKTSYQPTFVTYLSRFLLNYDRSSANWWRDQLRGVPLTLERQLLSSIRERQFGQFSQSVEFGLQKYQGKAGVRDLFSFLRYRYGTSKQAKLQLALLFSIISPLNQPSDLIRRALGQADDGVVTAACLIEGGRGYTSTETPEVVVSKPNGGGKAAVFRAELATTGQLSSVVLSNGGSGYLPGASPTVIISPPSGAGGRRAQAVARVYDGQVVSLELTDRGRGYRKNDVVVVTIDPPRNEYGVPVFLSAAAEAEAELDAGVVRPPVDLVAGRPSGGATLDSQLFRWQSLAPGGSPHSRGTSEPLDGLSVALARRRQPGEAAHAHAFAPQVRLVLEEGSQTPGKGYARDQALTLDIAPPRQGGRAAAAKLELTYSDIEALPSDGPYSDYYPEDSISAELLRLLPPTVRPARRADGKYSFPLAAPAALQDALERNGGRPQGLDVNMESYLYAQKTSGLRQKLPFAVDRDPTFGPYATRRLEPFASSAARLPHTRPATRPTGAAAAQARHLACRARGVAHDGGLPRVRRVGRRVHLARAHGPGAARRGEDAARPVERARLGAVTARGHGLLAGRLLLAGCSPRPGGATEPRSLLQRG